MRLDLDFTKKDLFNNFMKDFIKELSNYLMKKDNHEMANDESYLFTRKKCEFLEDFFSFRNSNNGLSKTGGETFIVEDKYENDPAGRYHIGQYKEGKTYLKVADNSTLPDDVQEGDILVMKSDGKLYHDREASKYVRSQIQKIRDEITEFNK